MQTSCTCLKTTLSEIAANPSARLAVHQKADHTHFSVASSTLLSRFKARLGIGETAAKRVAEAILNQQANIESLTQKMWLEDKNDVSLINLSLKRAFIKAGIPGKMFNLFEGQYEKWMEGLPDSLKDKKISQITLPGTHDSGSYRIAWNHPIVDNYISRLCRMFPFAQGIIADWTITQQVDVAGQLEKGIRVLDCRVAFDETAKQFYFSHTFACDRLIDSLQAIKNFLNENKGEVILLLMKPDWDNREVFYPQITAFTELVEKELEGLLCRPYAELPTLNEMVQRDERVIFVWSGDVTIDSEFVWPCTTYRGHWCDSADVQTNIAYIEKLLERVPENIDSFFNVSLTVTPQASTIISSIFGVGPRNLQSLTNEVQIGAQKFFIDQTYRTQLERVGVIATDLFYAAFVPQIIDLNHQKALKEHERKNSASDHNTL